MASIHPAAGSAGVCARGICYDRVFWNRCKLGVTPRNAVSLEVEMSEEQWVPTEPTRPYSIKPDDWRQAPAPTKRQQPPQTHAHEDSCPKRFRPVTSLPWGPEVCNCSEIRTQRWVDAQRPAEKEQYVSIQPGDAVKLELCPHYPMDMCCQDWIPQNVAVNTFAPSQPSLFSVLTHKCGTPLFHLCDVCKKKMKPLILGRANATNDLVTWLWHFEQLGKRDTLVPGSVEELVCFMIPEYMITGTSVAKEALQADWLALQRDATDHENRGFNAAQVLSCWANKHQRSNYPIKKPPLMNKQVYLNEYAFLALLLALHGTWAEKKKFSKLLMDVMVTGRSACNAFTTKGYLGAHSILRKWVEGPYLVASCVCHDVSKSLPNNSFEKWWCEFDPYSFYEFIICGKLEFCPTYMHCGMPIVPSTAGPFGIVSNYKMHPCKVALRRLLDSDEPMKRLGWLNSYYPTASHEDNKHMTTKICNLVVNSYKYDCSSPAMRWRREELQVRVVAALDWVLSNFAFGTEMNRAIGAFVALLEPDEPCARMLKWCASNKMLDMPPDFYRKVFKTVSNSMRRHSALPDGTPVDGDFLVKAAYFEKCGSRAIHIADPAPEVADRCRMTRHLHYAGPLANEWFKTPHKDELGSPDEDFAFYNKLKELADDAMPTLIHPVLSHQSFNDAMETGHQWMASGSAGADKVTINDKEVNCKKRTLMEHKKQEELREVINKPPVQVATASNKCEPDRDRALLAGNMDHYLVNSYCTAGMEDRLKLLPGVEKALRGVKQRAAEFKRQTMAVDPKVHLLMMDYENFNIHHTPRAMAILFTSIANAARRQHCHPDFIKANQWVARSMYASYINFSGLGDPSRKRILAVQGMFSGTRSTDFINTLLNLFYFNIARQLVKERFNIDLEDLYHVHQGDDSYVASKSIVASAVLYVALRRMGCKMQATKQMIGFLNAEFLRVFNTELNARGFLWRAFGSLVERPVQEATSFEPVEAIKAVRGQMSVLVRRGMTLPVATLIYHDQLKRLAVFREWGGGKEVVKIPRYLIFAPVWRGGFGCPPPGTECRTKIKLPPYPTIDFKVRDTGLKDLPSHLSDAWVKWIKARVPDLEIATGSLVQAAMKCNYASLIRERVPRSKLRSFANTWKGYITKLNAEYMAMHSVGELVAFNDRREGLQWHIEQLRAMSGCGLYSATKTSAPVRRLFRYVYVNELLLDIKADRVNNPGVMELAKRAIQMTAFKSTSVALVAFSGNAELMRAHLIDCATYMGYEGSALLGVLTRTNAQDLMKLLELDAGIRFGPSVAMCESMQPLDITYCVDEAMALLWECGDEFKRLTDQEKLVQVLLTSADLLLQCLDVLNDNNYDVIY